MRVVCALADDVITHLHARLALLLVELEVGVDQTRLLLLSGWVGLRWWPWFLCKKYNTCKSAPKDSTRTTIVHSFTTFCFGFTFSYKTLSPSRAVFSYRGAASAGGAAASALGGGRRVPKTTSENMNHDYT